MSSYNRQSTINGGSGENIFSFSGKISLDQKDAFVKYRQNQA